MGLCPVLSVQSLDTDIFCHNCSFPSANGEPHQFSIQIVENRPHLCPNSIGLVDDALLLQHFQLSSFRKDIAVIAANRV